MSELKTNKISTNDGNNVAIDTALGLKSYTTAQRDALSSPQAGDTIYNSETGTVDFYNGSSWNATSDNTFQFSLSYLVIAGGGSGGKGVGTNISRGTAGGGAGGYRVNYASDVSGGNSSTESSFTATNGTNYAVTIGAGGAAQTGYAVGNPGSNSVMDTIVSIGGGFGGYSNKDGGDGGSGGGAGYNQGATTPTANQGTAGGYGWTNGSTFAGGGGGGAGAAGANAAASDPGDGGDGLSSAITGTNVTRAGGGGGCLSNVSTYIVGSFGGAGGGGANGVNGTINTGSGGGGGDSGDSGAGGSGVVILRYPDTKTITIGAGLTGTTATFGSDKVTTITAGTGNVSFS
jgi:hypothetical protein